MVAPALLESIQDLSVADKLSLIEAITQMLQDEWQSKLQVNGTTQKPASATALSPIKTGQQDMKALIAELLSRPDPTPEQMLPRGLLKGMRFDEEDFRAAEWHPSEKELLGE